MEIYGVNFDFNIATLRPDSDPVLNQVLALFSADPAYTGEIGGHTDNIGKPDYNLKLSGQRADAVKAWLVANWRQRNAPDHARLWRHKTAGAEYQR